MSRGHGEIQRMILRVLDDDIEYWATERVELRAMAVVPIVPGWSWLRELAEQVFDLDLDDEPSRAQLESVRRAAKALAREGHVKIGYDTDDMQVRMTVTRLPK